MTSPTATPANADAKASSAQWQRLVDVLEEAALSCDVRGEYATERFEEWADWHFDAEAVRSAADTLRLAAPMPLPISFPGQIAPAEADPLQLLQQAWAQLDALPDNLDDVPMLTARFAVADALAAVRTHYE